MALQLPTRGARPSNYEYSWDERASSSSSRTMATGSPSTTIINGHDNGNAKGNSNSKGEGKMRSGMAASNAPPSSAFLQSQRGSSSMYSTSRGTSSDNVNDIRVLEDKLLHASALLQNRWVACRDGPWLES